MTLMSRIRAHVVVFCLVIAGILLAQPMLAQVSAPTPILPSAPSSSVLAVSPSGVYVLGQYDTGSGQYDFFLWSASAGVTDLGPTPVNGITTNLVNNAGQVTTGGYGSVGDIRERV